MQASRTASNVPTSSYNVMLFKVPQSWTDGTLREAVAVFGPTISVELFRPKEGEPGFDMLRHKGFGKVVFTNKSSVEALFAQSTSRPSNKYGEQSHIQLAGETLVVKRERLQHDRAVEQEQTRDKVEAGLRTKRICVETVGANKKSLKVGVQHEFKLKVKNNGIHSIGLPQIQRALPPPKSPILETS